MSGGLLPGTILTIEGHPVIVQSSTRWELPAGATVRAHLNTWGNCADYTLRDSDGLVLSIQPTLARAVEFWCTSRGIV